MDAFSRVLLDAFSRVLLARLVVPALCRRSCVVARPRRSSTSPRVRLQVERAPLRASLALRSLEDHPKRPFEASRSRGERRAFLSASAARSAAAVARVISRNASFASARAVFDRFSSDGSSTSRRATRSATENTLASRPSRASESDSSRAAETKGPFTFISRDRSPRASVPPSPRVVRHLSSSSATTRRTARAHEARSGAATAKEASAAARSARRARSRSGIVGAKERVDECVRGVAGDDAKVFFF